MADEHEVMEVDVLFVGGGLASLSGAIHLSNLIKKHNEEVSDKGEGDPLDEPMIAVLEKGPYVGAHNMSGAVMNPVALKELIPDFEGKGCPLEAQVSSDEVVYLTKSGGRLKSPFTPPPLNNHGHYVVSLSRFTEWLGAQAEEAEINIFPEFAGTEILYEGDKVVGVRTGDKGIDAHGEKKGNYEPGIDLVSKVTVFGEGPRGSLTKQLKAKMNLDGPNPQTYVVGVKEVWEVPEGRMEPGKVIHTMGFPHSFQQYGGGFIYGMKNNHVALGLLTGLDYGDPFQDPHREFQKFKGHPYVKKIIDGGKMVQYGAKTAPVGGYWALPRLTVDGGMIIGDSAGFFVSQKIKGLHAAMKSGMMAAEAIMEGMKKNDFSQETLSSYEKAIKESYVGQEMYKCRNFHQAFHNGLVRAMISAGFQYILGGKILKDRLPAEPDFSHHQTVSQAYGVDSPSEEQKGNIKFDGEQTFDKETDVYHAGATHEEQQPPHLRILDLSICYGECAEKYQNPCTRFCPAAVYEMVENEETGKKEMRLNFSNCLHCKTCDVKDPFENINWVPPEGGGGPKYSMM